MRKLISKSKIDLLSKRENREVYFDGKYIIKKRPNVYLDLENYNNFAKHNDWLVKVIDISENTIVMEKVEGEMFYNWRLTASQQQLYKICIEFKDKVWKSYFEFATKNQGTRWFDADNKIFFNGDAVPGNVIISEGRPIFLDPDAWTWKPWDLFVQKIRQDDMIWFNEYVECAHRKNPNE